MVETRTDRDAQNKVWDMIRHIKVATMVTLDAQGHFRGRPMWAQQESFDTTLWFFARKDSPVVGEIAADARVLLAYAEPDKQDYVSISGEARSFTDAAKQKALWSEGMRAWFPEGPEDPSLTLIAVEVAGAEYWDAPSSRMLHAYGYVKALATGKPPQGGENAKVSFA
jgi:general stress protein 26